MANEKKPAQAKGATVKVGGVISDGEKGFLKEGDKLPAGCDEKALKAKGYI